MTNPIAQSSTMNPVSPWSVASTPTALNDQRQNATFPTLNPPPMKTMVYAPDVSIQIAHNGQMLTLDKDIVRGQVIRKENAASTL